MSLLSNKTHKAIQLHHEKTCLKHNYKTKAELKCRITAQLISPLKFVFITQIIYFSPKIQHNLDFSTKIEYAAIYSQSIKQQYNLWIWKENIWPSANKDSNCWGQDISSSYSKSIENTRLSLCFFKTMASKENMLKISW